jgi:hypothetical protein
VRALAQEVRETRKRSAWRPAPHDAVHDEPPRAGATMEGGAVKIIG